MRRAASSCLLRLCTERLLRDVTPVARCASSVTGEAGGEPLRSGRFVDWLRVVARGGDGGTGCVR